MNLVCTIGTSLLGYAAKRWTVYERFFYRAVWLLEGQAAAFMARRV